MVTSRFSSLPKSLIVNTVSLPSDDGNNPSFNTPTLVSSFAFATLTPSISIIFAPRSIPASTAGVLGSV